MLRIPCLVMAAAALCGDLAAQINSRGPGYDGRLHDIGSPRAWGRRGPAHPGGEVGISFQNDLCNPGSMALAWFAADGDPAGMDEDHPKFGFLVARVVDDRLVQISDWSFCKHAFVSTNSPGPCGSCGSQPWAEQMFVGCSDIYSNANNASRPWLGPPSEINPWLGTWEATGSYFDLGDDGLSPIDGVKGLMYAGTDPVKHRVTIQESDLGNSVTSDMWFQIHVIHEGEPVANRGDNLMSRELRMTYNTSLQAWSTSTTGSATHGSILSRWNGATITEGQNGIDDGRFFVAVKVTGPSIDGMWHYEYAVHNVDNHRGGASFSLPLCSSARVENVGFRDIDKNALNDWTFSHANDVATWSAPAGNAHRWNQLFNFWFDCDVAPGSGNASIAQADLGPGALTVTVPTTVPSWLPAVTVPGGCGTPACTLVADGLPTAGNPNFRINVLSDPNTFVVLFFSLPGIDVEVVPGCHVLIDLNAYGTFGFNVTDASGTTFYPTPVDPTWPDIQWQAVTLIPNPPLLGLFGLSNGLNVRYNSTGCP